MVKNARYTKRKKSLVSVEAKSKTAEIKVKPIDSKVKPVQSKNSSGDVSQEPIKDYQNVETKTDVQSLSEEKSNITGDDTMTLPQSLEENINSRVEKSEDNLNVPEKSKEGNSDALEQSNKDNLNVVEKSKEDNQTDSKHVKDGNNIDNEHIKEDNPTVHEHSKKENTASAQSIDDKNAVPVGNLDHNNEPTQSLDDNTTTAQNMNDQSAIATQSIDNDPGASKEDDKTEQKSPSVEQQPSKKLSFDSLTANEKEYISNKIRNQVLQEEELKMQFCFSFIDWLVKQFDKMNVPPPSATLMSNLGFLMDKTKTPQMFISEGTEELVTLYYGTMDNEIEMKYNDEIDIESLAAATRKYIQDKVVFIDRSIMKKIYENYSRGENKEYSIKRLPFLLMNRSVFKDILNITRDQNINKEESGVDIAKASKVWSGVIFNDEFKNEESISPQLKAKITQDLFEAEFEYLSPEFYN